MDSTYNSDINKCCFCDTEIDMCSQSCGFCSRSITSFNIGLTNSLPDHLNSNDETIHISYNNNIYTENEFRNKINQEFNKEFDIRYNSYCLTLDMLLEMTNATIINKI
jgi:hypothetical protein